MAQLDPRLRQGEVLAGKYRVDRVLGAGAMGVVVAAHHLGLDTGVAIKLLLPEMLENEEAVARFAREARAAAKITSEHMTRVLDVGVLENGAPYMVMEFLQGVDLHQSLQQTGPLSVGQAIDYVLQACEAVGEAHQLGIVHRDLKPSNLFCVRRPNGETCIKVLDFGISKMSSIGGGKPSMGMTRTSMMMGTPLYMSPEQMESPRGVDRRTDVWSLGVILFELLTGQLPFYGETLPEVCLKVTTRTPPPVRTLRPDVPVEVEAAILKALEKDRLNRWPSVADFCVAIAPFCEVGPNSSSERVRRTMMAPLTTETMAPPEWTFDHQTSRRESSFGSLHGVGHTAARWRRRRTGWVRVAIAATLILGTLASATILLRGRLSDPPMVERPPSVAGATPQAAPSPPDLEPIPAPPASEKMNLDPAEITTPPAPTGLSWEERESLVSRPKPKSKPRLGATNRVGQPPKTAEPSSPPDPAKGSSAYDERL